MKTVPYLVEQYLSTQALQSAGVNTIAINLAELLLLPGVELIIKLGGLANWLNWPGAIIPLLGRDTNFIENRIQVNQQGVLIKNAQGNAVQITPIYWVLWQHQMGLRTVTPFVLPVQQLSRNKQKMVASQQAQWQHTQDEVCKLYQLSRHNLNDFHIDDQAVQLALQGRALVGDQILDCHAEQYYRDLTPLDPTCLCAVCQEYSKAYLHQMIKHHEAYGVRLLMMHNLTCQFAI